MPLEKYNTIQWEDEVMFRKPVNIEQIHGYITNIHKDTKQRSKRNRKQRRDEHNRKTSIETVNFSLENFVLGRRAKPCGHKMKFIWVGPGEYQQSNLTGSTKMEDILHGGHEVVHAGRICLYRTGTDGSEVDPELLKAAQYTDAAY